MLKLHVKKFYLNQLLFVKTQTKAKTVYYYLEVRAKPTVSVPRKKQKKIYTTLETEARGSKAKAIGKSTASASSGAGTFFGQERRGRKI